MKAQGFVILGPVGHPFPLLRTPVTTAGVKLTAADIEKRRKAFLRKWQLKCCAVADSLQEAGDRLFTFTRLNPSHWKSAQTTNAVERLNEEFRRRIKTQTVLPCAETVQMLLRALMASSQAQINRLGERRQTVPTSFTTQPGFNAGYSKAVNR